MKRQRSGTTKAASAPYKKPRIASSVAGGAQVRKGYSAVTRTSGAAVIGEMKYFDANLINTAVPITTTSWPAGSMFDPSSTINLGSAAVANPLCLFAPTVGSALNQRVGRKVKVLKIKINGILRTPTQAAQNTADVGSYVRIMLVQDTQTNSAQMTGAQLLNDGDAAETTINAFQNPNNFGRFKVLKQLKMVIEDPNMAGEVGAGNVVQMGKKKVWEINHKFRMPVEVHFNATNGGTVGDIIDHSFHLVVATDSTALTPGVSYYSRVCYKE